MNQIIKFVHFYIFLFLFPFLLFAIDLENSTCASGDCKNGIGTLVFENGDKYEGSFKEGKLDGYGVFTFENGDVYNGEVKENLFVGNGTYTYYNGDQFTGEFAEGFFKYGTLTTSKGNRFVGTFYNNRMQGQGVLYDSKGKNIYTGTWVEGCPSVLVGEGICEKYFLEAELIEKIRGLGRNMDKVKISPYLQALKNLPTIQTIDPAKENNVIGGKGVKLIIPPDAFTYENGEPVKGKVKIQLTEVIDAFDFMTAGVGLEYFDENGKEYLFESGGMFKIEAIENDKPLKIADGKKIQVMFPDVYPKTEFNVYKMNERGKWVLNDEKLKRLSFSNRSMFEEFAAQAAPASEGINNESPAQQSSAPPTAKRASVPVAVTKTFGVIVTSINNLGWLNIDYPNLVFGCIKGDVEVTLADGSDKPKSVSVMAIGLDHSYIRTRWTTSGKYELDVLKNKKVKLLAIDEDGNVGISDTIKTPDKTGYSRGAEGEENFKMPVSKITLKKLEGEALKDKASFKNFLGIQDKDYKVEYPKEEKPNP